MDLYHFRHLRHRCHHLGRYHSQFRPHQNHKLQILHLGHKYPMGHFHWHLMSHFGLNLHLHPRLYHHHYLHLMGLFPLNLGFHSGLHPQHRLKYHHCRYHHLMGLYLFLHHNFHRLLFLHYLQFHHYPNQNLGHKHPHHYHHLRHHYHHLDHYYLQYHLHQNHKFPP